MINSAFDGVIFRLHGMIFAIEALKVREVVGGAVWQPAEGEGGIQSSIQTRGRVIPVVDLRRLFGFPSMERSGLNSFIAVQLPGGDRSRLAALWVDSLLDMIHVPPGELKAVPDLMESVSPRFLQGVAEKDGEKIYIVQTDEILREEFFEGKELKKAAS